MGKKIAIGCTGAAVLLLIALTLFLLFAFQIVSCADRSVLSGQGYTTDYAVAVIKTNVSNPVTFIEYYDEGLNLVNKLEYPYATLENSWGNAEYFEGTVYLAAQGIEGFRNGDTVVALDTETGIVTEYDSGIGAPQSVTANEQYVFAVNQGQTTNLSRIDKVTSEVLSARPPGLLHPFAYEDRLYILNQLFKTTTSPTRASLLIFNAEDLSTVGSIDLGDNMVHAQTIGFIDERLFFITSISDDSVKWVDKEWYINYYSPTDNTIHEVASITGMRLNYLVVHDDTLYVLGTASVVGDSRNKILAIDFATGAVFEDYPLTYEPEYICTRDGVLYVTGYDDNDIPDLVLGAYAIEEDGLRMLNEVHFANHEQGQSGRYYLSGLFTQG